MSFDVIDNRNDVTQYYKYMKEMGEELENLISGSEYASIQLLYLKGRVYGFNFSSKFFELVGYSKEDYLLLEEDKYGNKLMNRTDLKKTLEWADSIDEGPVTITDNVRFMNKENGYMWFETKVSCKKLEENVKVITILFVRSQASVYGENSAVETLLSRAVRDPLTNLYNREKLKSLVNEYLECGENMKGAFLMVDIDDFKKLNDNLGHQFGDETLKYIANKFEESFSNAYIGRIGGDELALFFPNFEVEKINEITDRMLEILGSMPIDENNTIKTTCSIGVAFAPKDGRDYDTLYEKSDKALYTIKNSGKSGSRCYDQLSETLHEEKERKFLNGLNEETTVYSEKEKQKHEILNLIYSLIGEDDKDRAEGLFFVALRKIGMLYHLDAVCVKDYSMRSREFEVVQIWKNDKFHYSKGYKHAEDAADSDRYLNAASQDEAVVIKRDEVFKSKASSVEVKEYFFENQIATGIYTPVMESNVLLGVISFETMNPDTTWSEEDMRSINEIGKALSLYLLKTKAFKYAEETIEFISSIDEISGLMKYENFLDSAKRLVEANKDVYRFFVSYIDINDFKVINERYGHMEGDNILKLIAGIIENKSAVNVFSSRVFSDCFVTLWRIDKHDNINKIQQDIEKWKAKISDIYEDVNLTISVGISEVYDSIHSAVENANFARKYKKEKFINSVTVFDDGMKEEYHKEHEVLDNFALALKNSEFFVQIQPKVMLPEKVVIGGEALVRWRNKDGKIIGPEEFIPYLEKTGNIKELDYYVYEEVFRYVAERMKNDQFVVPISLNVSGRHMKDESFCSDILKYRDKYKVPAEMIEFEITENVFLSDHDRANKILKFLKSEGFKISIDDFGVGYSSLSILNDLSFDVLKLDRSFINKDLKVNDKILLSGIIDMAGKLGIEVLCEGVETKEQLEVLQSMGCKLIQGFYFSRPLSYDKFEEFIENDKMA